MCMCVCVSGVREKNRWLRDGEGEIREYSLQLLYAITRQLNLKQKYLNINLKFEYFSR